MKKILFVLSQLSTGGAERVISILANNFDARGYEVHLITYVDVPNAYILNKEILWTKFPSISGNRIKQHLIRMRLIRKYIRDNRIDAYITFEHYYGWTCAFKNHVRYITSMRNDPLHDKVSIMERFLRKLNFVYASAVVFQTSEIMDYFPDSVQKHGYIIKNPLPNNIPEYSIHKEKRIVAVSRLEPQKNLFMLLKAFQTVSKINSDYKLEIYGEGSERKAVEQTIQRLGLSNNVVLKGFQKKVNEKNQIRQKNKGSWNH